MVDVEKLLCDTIEKLNFNIYLQGSLKEDEIEDKEFCTYSLDPIEEIFKDNAPVMAHWLFDFNFYSINKNYGATFENLLLELKKVGFVPVGRGMGVMSDNKRFAGRSVQIRYKEIY